MLNPTTQLFQITQPYILEGQQFNPPNLSFMDCFFLRQDHFFYQQAHLQTEQSYLYQQQNQALPVLKIYPNFPRQNYLKVETPLKMEQESSSNMTQLKDIPCKSEEYDFLTQSLVTNEESKVIHLRVLITEMLQFFITKFGQANDSEIEQQRSQYNDVTPLLKLFDSLKIKYTFSTKCREDKVRFIFRKAMTFLRDSLRDRFGFTAKEASIKLCKKYFLIQLDEKDMKQIQKSDKDFLSLLLPYKRNSRNKTANSRFIKEIFGSEAFYYDYLFYVSHLDRILEFENQRKIDKFAVFLEQCMKEKAFHKIKNFKRVPWLEKWLAETKNIAYEFLITGKPSQERTIITDLKKLKTFR